MRQSVFQVQVNQWQFGYWLFKGSLSDQPGRMSTGSWSNPQGLRPIPTQYRPENVFFGIWICDVGPKGGCRGRGGQNNVPVLELHSYLMILFICIGLEK